uniref:Uncharacterized protein n=1 Tax=Oryza brachyantha TaxID=4533 RepID=J3LWW2_ORYBR
MGNVVNTVKKLSGNNADAIPLQRCSCLPNRIPRLDKYTFDENGSSVTRKSTSAINNPINGHTEVVNEEMHLATDCTSKLECNGDTCTNKERETQNETNHTDLRQNMDTKDANNSDNVVLICNQTAGHISYELGGESNRSSGSLAGVNSEVLVSKAPPEKRLCTGHEEAGDLESTPNTRVRKRSRLSRVSPANNLFDHEASDDFICRGHNLDCSHTPNLHDEMVPNEDKIPCASLDVSGCENTPKTSSKRRVNKKRTKHESSNQTTELYGNTGALVVIQIPLTRTKAKALCLATPEYLRRSTRSGRLIVPRLDPGSQNIMYDMFCSQDGSIFGITNLELPQLQGPYSEPPSRRRKRPRCSSPGHRRLLLF